MEKVNKIYWERYYRKLKSKSFWPWTDVVVLCNKYFKKKKDRAKVLEIGVGNGANIPFFLKGKYDFYGIDSSSYIIKILKKKYKKISKNFICGDFEEDIFDKKFDLILDRGSITCGNNSQRIDRIIKVIQKNLKRGGFFISVDWYSKNCTDFKNKKKKKGQNFFSFKKGPFKNIGQIYFSDLTDIKKRLNKFKIIHIEEKQIINSFKNRNIFASWSIVAKK